MAPVHCAAYLPQAPRFRAAWPQLVADTTVILDHLAPRGIRTAGPHGHGEPLLTATTIIFNGRHPHARGDLYLSLDPRPVPGYSAQLGTDTLYTLTHCDTGNQPYNLAVTAVLLRARLLAPDHFVIGSCHSWTTGWRAARSLIHALFGLIPITSQLTDPIQGPAAAG